MIKTITKGCIYKPFRHAKSQNCGFTLIELMVVMAIIVVLIAISVPVLSGIKKQALRTANQAQINSIHAACEKYQVDQRTYPGLWANSQLGGANSLTASEALVLAMMGGVVASNPAPPAPTVDLPGTLNPAGAQRKYSLPKVGSGPVSGNPGNLQQLDAYYAYNTEDLVDFDGNGFCEFRDKSSDGMPIVYFRANIGRSGVAVANANTSPYNFAHGSRYFTGANYKNARTVTEIINSGSGTTGAADGLRTARTHALATDKTFATYITTVHTVPAGTVGWNANDGWSSMAVSSTAASARPANSDRFLLISAGEDGYFGPYPNVGSLQEQIQKCDDVMNWSR